MKNWKNINIQTLVTIIILLNIISCGDARKTRYIEETNNSQISSKDITQTFLVSYESNQAPVNVATGTEGQTATVVPTSYFNYNGKNYYIGTKTPSSIRMYLEQLPQGKHNMSVKGNIGKEIANVNGAATEVMVINILEIY